MKTLYLECNMGAAGDMLMAALTELMPDKDAFVKELNDLQIPQVNIERTTIAKCGIMGTHMVVTVNGEEEKSIEDLLNEIEGNRNMSIGDIEEKIKDKMEEEEEESISDDEFLKEFMARTSKKEEEETIKEEKATTKEEDVDADKTLEHDLFNLIDSMYEDKEGE